MYFEKATFYFFTSNPAFSQAYVLQQKLASQYSTFALSTKGFFSADDFAGGYNHEITIGGFIAI
jgi:hypothetical protein